jgi:hypothetical protein
MTEEERKRRVQAILDKHDEAFRALREAREASGVTVGAAQRVDTSVGTSIEGLRTVLDGLASANDANQVVSERAIVVNNAIGRAIDAALDANQMALALFNEP